MNKLSYRVIRSDRRTIAIHITPQGEVLVRCPRRMGMDAVEAFVRSKASWIAGHLEKQKALPQKTAFSVEELQDLKQKAKTVIPQRVTFFAPLVGVTYGRITIRSQRSLWGSCSGKGNLNFNCLLMLTPPEVVDYIVVHELCHRKEMNHSEKFWMEVERVMPDYKQHQKWLRENGSALIRRLNS